MVGWTLGKDLSSLHGFKSERPEEYMKTKTLLDFMTKPILLGVIRSKSMD